MTSAAGKLSNMFMLSAEMGARTSLYCALEPELSQPEYSGLEINKFPLPKNQNSNNRFRGHKKFFLSVQNKSIVWLENASKHLKFGKSFRNLNPTKIGNYSKKCIFYVFYFLVLVICISILKDIYSFQSFDFCMKKPLS